MTAAAHKERAEAMLPPSLSVLYLCCQSRRSFSSSYSRIFLELLRREVPFFSLKLRYEGERLAYAALNGREMER